MPLDSLDALDLARFAQVLAVCRENGVAAISLGDIRVAFEPLAEAPAVAESAIPQAAAPLTDDELLFLHERVGA
jgi:hypothetical protein